MKKRRHYFINKRFQGRFIIYFLIHGIFIAFSTSVVIWHFSSEKFETFIYRSHIMPVSPWEVVSPVMIKAIVISSAVLIISAYLLSNVIFNRISKSLRHLNDALESIGRGNLSITTVRGSGMEEINETLTMFVDKIKEDVSSLQTLQREIKNLIDKAEKAQDNKAILTDMEDVSKAFMKRLSECRINIE
jgi:sensor histidine kinase YesM